MTLWITLMDHNMEMDKEILFLYLFSGTSPYRGEMRLKRDLSNSFIYDGTPPKDITALDSYLYRAYLKTM